MVRKQLYIGEELDRALAQRARSLGVSQAELARIALEKLLQKGDADGPTSTATAFEALWGDSDLRGTRSGGVSWTRESLHER
jgi:hypothetical protein